MSTEVSGQGGAGAVTVYTLAVGETALLETLSFTVVTDATLGVHSVRLTLANPTVGTIARLDDLNAGGPGQTNFYTYGLGLNASACTITTGMAVTDALPWTELQPGATITLEAIDDTGTEITGDVFSAVLMHFAGAAAAAPTSSNLPLTLLPGAA